MKHLKTHKLFLCIKEQFINNYNVDIIVKFIEEFSGDKNLKKIASGGNGYIFDYDNSDYYIKVTGSVEEMSNVRKLAEEKLTNVMYIKEYTEEYIEELDSEYFWFYIEKLDELDYYHEKLLDIFFKLYKSKFIETGDTLVYDTILDKINNNNDLENLFTRSEYKGCYMNWKDEIIKKHGSYKNFFKVIFDFKNGINELRRFKIILTDVGLHNVMYDYTSNNLKIIDIGE